MKLTKYIALGLALLLFAGCSAPKTSATTTLEPTNGAAKSDVFQLSYTEKRSENVDPEAQFSKDVAAVVEKINQFSGDIYSRIDKSAGNSVFSPFSVYIALACVMNGSSGETAAELQKALLPAGMTLESFNKAVGELITTLTYDAPLTEEEKQYGIDPSKTLKIELASLLCSGKGETMNADFAKLCKEYFAADAASADFSNDEATALVNDWAKEATHGLIDPLFSSNIDPETVLLIANSIYFAGQWELQFDAASTRENDFFGADGKKSGKAQFMVNDGSMSYIKGDKYAAVKLNYLGGAYMEIFLPNEGVSLDDITRLMATEKPEYTKQKGHLELPKFSIDADIKLSDTLKAMNMPSMFAGGLTEMLATENKNNELFVSDAIQKARIEVNEEGTVAAAVTVMKMAGTALEPPTTPFELVVNRPFAYRISAAVGNGAQTLFIGQVTQPVA